MAIIVFFSVLNVLIGQIKTTAVFPMITSFVCIVGWIIYSLPPPPPPFVPS